MRQGDLRLTFHCMEHKVRLVYDDGFQWIQMEGDPLENIAVFSPDIDGLHCPGLPTEAMSDTCRARWYVDIDQRQA